MTIVGGDDNSNLTEAFDAIDTAQGDAIILPVELDVENQQTENLEGPLLETPAGDGEAQEDEDHYPKPKRNNPQGWRKNISKAKKEFW